MQLPYHWQKIRRDNVWTNFKKRYLMQAPDFLYKMLRKKNITLNGKKAEGKRNPCPGRRGKKCFFSEETYASAPVPGQRKILPITVRLTVP